MRRVWNSTLVRRAELARGKGPSRKTKLKAVNVDRDRRHRREYDRKLSAYRRSETYRVVDARARGRCEGRVTAFRPFPTPPFPHGVLEVETRCTATEGLEHHHRTYARFGGQELPEDVAVLCRSCHAREEQLNHPHRRHGRRGGR